MAQRLVLLCACLFVSAIAVPAECASDAGQASAAVWQSHKTVRKCAVSLEQGALDNMLLDAAQTSVSAALEAVRSFRSKCGHSDNRCNGAMAAVSAMGTKGMRCGCRPLRLMNMTATTARRLDDLAAGVLFGDSEQNMLLLSNAAPEVMDALKLVGEGLDQYQRRCSAKVHAAASAR